MALRDKSALISEIARERVLVLDGALGTLLERAVARAVDCDRLVLTRPELVRDVHAQYLAAGADIIETNTFNANAVSQADYGHEPSAYELNRRAAELAVGVARAFTERMPEQPRFVAGALGPTSRTLGLRSSAAGAGGSIAFEPLYAAYAEQARGLIDGGVDLLLCETVYDSANLQACLRALADVQAERRSELPLMISVTIGDPAGRTASGQTLAEFWASVAHAQPLSVGVNCSLGARRMRPFIAELSAVAAILTSVYPSAGFRDAAGVYPEGPAETAALLADFARRGLANIVGGCCGTTPEHTAATAAAVRGIAPRQP